MTVERSTISASGGHADAVRWAATLPTGVGGLTWRRSCYPQRLSLRGRGPSPLWWGMQVAKPASSLESTPCGARARLTAVRTTALWPDSPRAGSRHANPVAVMERATAMESAPLPETRSDCARVPTTSHSSGGGLTGNDERAGRVPVTLSKRSLNLLWFTGLPPTGWEAGWHVSIEAPADLDRALAGSLRRGKPSSGQACFHGRPIRSTGIRCRP